MDQLWFFVSCVYHAFAFCLLLPCGLFLTFLFELIGNVKALKL